MGLTPASAISRIRRCVLWAGAGIVALLLLVPAGAMAANARRVGRKPVIPAGAQFAGQLAPSTPLRVTVTLTPRDPAALAAYATAVSTPGSSLYHQYLSVSQFAQRFGPTPAQIADARTSLRGQGLSPGAVSANGLSIRVNGSAGRLSSAFGTSFERYRLRGGRTAYANTSAPQVSGPGASVIQAVIGLDNLAARQPQGLVRHGQTTNSQLAGTSPLADAVSPCAGAASTGAYTANQIAGAYSFNPFYNAGDLGAGATVGLYELEPYAAGDIATYQSCYGTSAAVTNIAVDGGASCGGNSQCGIEDVLDIEDVVGLVPRAHVLVYEGPNNDQGAYDTYAKIVNQDLAKVISTSWGLCEAAAVTASVGTPAAENTLFQEAAAQGQSIFAAAGDSGSNDCGSGGAKTPSVDDPASQPYVTGVGGTSLTVGPPRVEDVWNNSTGAGGGGVSTLWSMPSYQSGWAVSQSGISCGSGSFACREVPDLSADADPNTGYPIYWNGSWGVIGGTSAAAPTLASLLALAEASSSCGGAPLGFLNPLLYRAAGSSYGTDFNDIQAGNNSFNKVPGYSALPGYDMASGLGSPQGANLASSICQGHDVVTFSSTPATQHGKVGRAITAVHLSAISSRGETPIIYSALGLPAGVSINPSSGVISGTPAKSGIYSVTILARDRFGTPGRAHFEFVIAGRPSASVGKLRIVGTHASLTLTVRAGQYASNLRKVKLSFGAGAHLSAKASVLKKDVRSLNLSGKRQAIMARVVNGRLYVTFEALSSASRVRLSGAELSLSRRLARSLTHHTKTLRLTVLMTDATGAQTRVTLKLR